MFTKPSPQLWVQLCIEELGRFECKAIAGESAKGF